MNIKMSIFRTVFCRWITWQNYSEEETACRCLSMSQAHHTLLLQKCKNMCFCSRVKTSFAVTAGLNFLARCCKLAGVSPGNLLVTRKPEARQPVQKVSPASQETVHCFGPSDCFAAAKTLTNRICGEKKCLWLFLTFFFCSPVCWYSFTFNSYYPSFDRIVGI